MTPIRHRFFRFLGFFNALALPVLGIMLMTYLVEDIPLKYLLPFILIYIVTAILSLVFDKKKTKVPTDFSIPVIVIITFVNALSIFLLSFLVDRYQLGYYRYAIYVSAVMIINTIYMEYQTHIFERLIRNLFQTSVGAWIIRTVGLLVVVGSVIALWNTFSQNPLGSLASKPRNTTSEVTGILSTVDPRNTVITPSITPPWQYLERGLGIGNTGEDVRSIIEYLRTTGYYSGSSIDAYSPDVGHAINFYIRDISGEVFTKTEFGPQKLALLRSKDIATDTLPTAQPPVLPSSNTEITGRLSTDSSVRIDSIESVDGGATATISNGKITVQVIPAPVTTETGTLWTIRSTLDATARAGALQGVVISAPYALPASGKYTDYQTIQLRADGASGIFFTIDGSEPNCRGNGLTEVTSNKKDITILAISCYVGNKIRGPLSQHTFTYQGK